MPNYENGTIYKIVCDDQDVKETYVGSTVNFHARACQHIHNCRDATKKAYNRKLYKFIRENGGMQNWSIILIEKYPCENKLELELRETVIVNELKATLNSKVPRKIVVN